MSRRVAPLDKAPLLGYHVMASRAAVAVPWYLAGGVSAANCVAAYQPIGAADYAASKVNLTGNTLYDITEVDGSPTFNTSTGWTGDLTKRPLNTGIIPSGDFTLFIRFSGSVAGNTSLMGLFEAEGKVLNIKNQYTLNRSDFLYGNGEILLSGQYSAGVFALAGKKIYINGDYKGEISATWTNPSIPIYVMGRNYSAEKQTSHTHQASAIYSAILTGDQVAAISAAMAALDGGAKSQSLEGMLSFEPEEETLWWQGADVDVLAQAQPQITQTWWDKANRVVNEALAKAKKFIDDKLYQLWQALEDYFTYDEEE